MAEKGGRESMTERDRNEGWERLRRYRWRERDADKERETEGEGGGN